MNRRGLSRDQKTTIVYGVMSFVVVLVILQLWLLTATMNAFLGGDDGVVVPALLASLGCFGMNLALLFWLYRIDREA